MVIAETLSLLKSVHFDVLRLRSAISNMLEEGTYFDETL